MLCRFLRSVYIQQPVHTYVQLTEAWVAQMCCAVVRWRVDSRGLEENMKQSLRERSCWVVTIFSLDLKVVLCNCILTWSVWGFVLHFLFAPLFLLFCVATIKNMSYQVE